MNDGVGFYRVTYRVTGKVTLPITAHSPSNAVQEAEREWPESDINWNHKLEGVVMVPVCVEDEAGNVTEITSDGDEEELGND